MQISFLKILPENALKFVSKKMRICVKNFAQLQELATEKNNEEQVKMCFEAYRTKNWSTLFD